MNCVLLITNYRIPSPNVRSLRHDRTYEAYNIRVLQLTHLKIIR